MKMLSASSLPLSAACLALGLFAAGCDDSDQATEGASGRALVTNPCAVFTEDIALGLGNGPYEAGRESVDGKVSLCMRGAEAGAPNIHGATARFERMDKAEFLDVSCQSPIDPRTGGPAYDVDILEGIHAAACRFETFGERFVGLQVLTQSGWAVLVGSASQEKCLAAIESIIPRLPP